MKTRTCLIGVVAMGLWLPLQTLGQTTITNGLIITDTTWTEAGSPYLVSSSVLIGFNATLTIEPGVVVRFDSGLGITVGHQNFGLGTLIARGTPDQRIHFRSSVSPQTPGAWARIHFTDFAIDADFDGEGNYVSGSILEHVLVEYAGPGNVGAVTIEKSRPYVSFTEIRDNSSGVETLTEK